MTRAERDSGIVAVAVRRRRATDADLVAVGQQEELTLLLTQVQMMAAQYQQRVEALRATIDSIPAHVRNTRSRDIATRLPSLAAVQVRVRELAETARSECLTLNPATAFYGDVTDARRAAYERVLRRGVSLRAVQTESYSNDPRAREHALWLTGLGARVRATSTVPLYLTIVDNTLALVPYDPNRPERGAIEVHHARVVAQLRALFEQTWAAATPLTGTVGPSPLERDLLRLIGEGHTDESAGRKLGLSVRTVRRMMAGLSDRLGARSRFQAGALAAHNGWV